MNVGGVEKARLIVVATAWVTTPRQISTVVPSVEGRWTGVPMKLMAPAVSDMPVEMLVWLA